MASVSKTIRPKRSSNRTVLPPGFALTAGRGTPSVIGGGGGTGWLANKPPSYTNVIQDYAFSTVPPIQTDGPMGDGSGWGVYGNASGTMTRVSDATEPQSPPYALDWRYTNGGASGGGVGKVYRTIPTSIQEIYVAFTIWHDANFEWNTISNKMFYWESGNLILQSRHSAYYLSFYNGGGGGLAYECNLATPVAADFEGKWATIEYQVVRGSPATVRVWLNGTPVMEYTSTFNIAPITSYSELNFDSTWGGSTGPRTRDSHRRVGHVYIASP